MSRICWATASIHLAEDGLSNYKPIPANLKAGTYNFPITIETLQIVSVEFAGKCATLHESAAAGVSFDLLDCSSESAEQKFIYNADTSEFMPESDQSLCIAAGSASKSAGPFMSRVLELAPCASTDTTLKQWVVKGGM